MNTIQGQHINNVTITILYSIAKPLLSLFNMETKTISLNYGQPLITMLFWVNSPLIQQHLEMGLN